MAYIGRLVDREIQQRLDSAGAVLIEGPRACGKTETGKRAAASSVFVDTDPGLKDLVAVEPDLVLEGATPRLIDEWQLAPQLWNLVRRSVDERQSPGQFILTGSAVPVDDLTRHSGAGRFSRLEMRPLSMFEMGLSSADISLEGLLTGAKSRSPDPGLGVRDLAELIIRGGWPEATGAEERTARRFSRDYLDRLSKVDIRRLDGIRYDSVKITALLASIARNSASEVSISTLSRDAGGTGGSMARSTVAHYLDTLERIFALINQPAWNPHLRSRATLRGAPKRHLVDPSLAAAAMNADSGKLLGDLETLGILFESLVFRDLLTYSQPLDGLVFHYRDSYDLEVDAIVDAPGIGWGAIEVKLSPHSIEDAAVNLLRFAESIDTKRTPKPSFLGVVTAIGYGYTRDDGVAVIPIGALGP